MSSLSYEIKGTVSVSSIAAANTWDKSMCKEWILILTQVLEVSVYDQLLWEIFLYTVKTRLRQGRFWLD